MGENLQNLSSDNQRRYVVEQLVFTTDDIRRMVFYGEISPPRYYHDECHMSSGKYIFVREKLWMLERAD